MGDVLIILANGFEEAEAVITVDVLRRLGIDVCIASVNDSPETESSGKIRFIADKKLPDCKNDKFKAVILPGGMPGTANLKNNGNVMEVIQKANERGAFVCAICAAPIVLGAAGVLEDVKFTVYPGFEEYFEKKPLTDMVVQDKNIITGKGPGAAFGFALRIGKALGKDTSAVARGMLLE